MNWEIQKRSDICSQCQKPFDERELFYSMVLEVQAEGSEGIERKDWCYTCWTHGGIQSELLPVARMYWRSHFRVIQKKEPVEVIEYSRSEILFRSFIMSPDVDQQKLCYLLALFLERKKKLVRRQVCTDSSLGTRIVMYEKPHTGETFAVNDPCLKLTDLAALQQQLASLMAVETTVQ